MSEKMINMKKSSLMDYKAVIFDLDGTLYFQKPFRVRMLCYLACHILRHPFAIKDVFLIKKYREVREEWEKIEAEGEFDKSLSLDERQYGYVAEKKGVSLQKVESAVKFFMFEAPLKLLPLFRDEELFVVINKLKKSGKKIIVYSDYPVENKLSALGITADDCFDSSNEAIGCMKPDPKGLGVILKAHGLDRNEAVMIGDRYEKDGLAAVGNQMDYVILESSRKKRKELFAKITG